MSLRDLFARIARRQPPQAGASQKIRSRSELTVRLPVEGRPDTVRAAGDALPLVDRESAMSASPSHPASSLPAAAAPALEQGRTEYPDGEGLKRDEVVGVLVAIDGELKGQAFRLFDGENRLGRAENCEIVLSSRWISRDHAMLVHHGGIFAIVSLTERNRTYVNGEAVDGIEVADSDTIRLGRTTFRFRTVEGL